MIKGWLVLLIFFPDVWKTGWYIGATLTADNHEQIQEIIINEIEKIVRNGVNEEELKQAKSVYLTNLIYSKDGSFQIADLINDAIAIGDWKDYLNFQNQ